MTKHESEKIVRKECKVPWSVYRPAMVVGDSSPARWTRSTARTTSSS
jgi:thioester reductase-like protein